MVWTASPRLRPSNTQFPHRSHRPTLHTPHSQLHETTDGGGGGGSATQAVTVGTSPLGHKRSGVGPPLMLQSRLPSTTEGGGVARPRLPCAHNTTGPHALLLPSASQCPVAGGGGGGGIAVTQFQDSFQDAPPTPPKPFA